MEIIESFQAFENLADRTFRGRSLGYQDEYEPEVDVAQRSNACGCGEPFGDPKLVLTHPAIRTSFATPMGARLDARTKSAAARCPAPGRG